MNELLKILLSLSLSGTLLILVLRLCKPLYKNRLSKQWQYYIWLVVIARLLLPFSPEINLMGNVFRQIDNTVSQSEVTYSEQYTPVSSTAKETENDLQVSGVGSSESGEQSTPIMVTVQNALNYLAPHLWLIWLFIAVLLLIRKITIYRSFVRYIKAGRVEISNIEVWERLGQLVERAGVKTAVSLYTNTLISSPLLIGFFKPCIMLPTTKLTDTEFEYTILHELTHYKRRDMFYKWLVQITICLHWFNPILRLMGKEISKACELSCDEAVIKGLDEKGKIAYGNTLIEAMKTGGKYEGALASVTLNGSVELLKERLDAIMSFKKKSRFVISLALVLTIVVCFGATALGAYTAPKQTNSNKMETKKNNGVLTIPVNIKSINDGEYVWLGEYTLSAGDKIRYNIPTISGEHIAVGFTRLTELSPTYFTQINNRSDDILKVIGGFEVPASLAGNYKLYIQAFDGKLADIKGTVEIGKITDGNNSTSKNVITVPVDIETAKYGAFNWLGEYHLSNGDKIHYNVSAAKGSGLQIGLVAQGDDPLNRTYYTASNKQYNGELEINTDFIFSDPVKPGQYKLFIRAIDGDDLADVKGYITITKQALDLEAVTLKGKTYYMIMTKEQLLALAKGQLSLDKNYMLQRDIDLSDTEWIPIGTAEKPFSGSFNGNGYELKGLTMTDPNTKVIGLFGYADGAKIYNITLRNYDIGTAGKNVKNRSISPILVFGTDTQCFDNFTYPKK